VAIITLLLSLLFVRHCGKQDVGMPADYVNKLARMFQDIKVSEDLNQEFKEAHRNNNEGLAGQLDACVAHLSTFVSCFVLNC